MKTLAIVGRQAQHLHPHLDVQPLRVKGVDLQCAVVPMPRLRPHPERLGPQDVLVRVRAFSCNYRDQGLLLQQYLGDPETCLWPVGSEFCGTVEATGQDVTGLRVGDRVLGNNAYVGGAYATGQNDGVVTNHASLEYQIHPARKLLPVPDTMSDETAAAFSLGAQTAYAMVRKARLHPGDHALVMSAASNTALFVLGALRARGAQVTICSSSPRADEIAHQYGARLVPSGEGAAERLRQAAQDVSGFDAVLDPFLDMNAGVAVPTLKPGGRYVSCGYLRQVDHDYDYRAPHITLHELLGLGIINNIEIHLNCLGHTSDLQAALHDHQAGRLGVPVDRVYGPGQEAAFLRRTFEDRARSGKVIYRYPEVRG